MAYVIFANVTKQPVNCNYFINQNVYIKIKFRKNERI